LLNGGPTIIAEHFHFPDFHLTPWVEYFNILRDPVDRCVSTFYFSRYGPRHADSKIAILDSYGDININQCFNSTELGQKPACWNCGTNTMASFFCGADGGGCQHLDRDERLGRAYANLQTYTVGITEYLEESMELLEHRFPTFFKGAKELYKTMPPQKVTAGDVHYEKPTQETRLKIEALLKSDREIYDIAKLKFLREYRECVKGIIEEEEEVGDGWAKEEEEEDDESVGEDSATAPV
jgi:dermatan/chondrotin sulfate uronyl 2-O-sulfotransferase UST